MKTLRLTVFQTIFFFEVFFFFSCTESCESFTSAATLNCWEVQDPHRIRCLTHTHTQETQRFHGVANDNTLIYWTKPLTKPGHTICTGAFLGLFFCFCQIGRDLYHKCSYVLTHRHNLCSKTGGNIYLPYFKLLSTIPSFKQPNSKAKQKNKIKKTSSEMQKGRRVCECLWWVTNKKSCWALQSFLEAQWLPSTKFPTVHVLSMYNLFSTCSNGSDAFYNWIANICLWNEWFPGHSLHPVNAKRHNFPDIFLFRYFLL